MRKIENGEGEEIKKEVGRVHCKSISQHLLGETEENNDCDLNWVQPTKMKRYFPLM